MANIYILSLGQLVNSDLSKSVNAFANLKSKQSYLLFRFNQLSIYLALAIDNFWYKTIEKFKLGEINQAEFTKDIAYQLGIKDDQALKDAWNIMCKISDNLMLKIVNFIKEKKSNPNDEIILFSHTNQLQFDFILEQINKQLSKENLGTLSDHLIMSNSYEQTNLLKTALNAKLPTESNIIQTALVKFAIKDKKLNESNNRFISFYSQITKAEDLRVQDLSYEPNTNALDAYVLIKKHEKYIEQKPSSIHQDRLAKEIAKGKISQNFLTPS